MWEVSEFSFQSHHWASAREMPPPSKFYQACLLQPVWRKLRGEVGHALDKCFYIWQRNHTTQVAGTIHAHHVQRWVAVQPDYCLQATVFVNNAGLHCWYPHNTRVILLSQLVWVKGLKPPVRIPPCYWMQRHFQNCGKANALSFELLFCGIVAAHTPLKSTTLECMLPHFHTGETLLFFGCASTLKEHINHAPREVTRFQLWLTKWS